MANFDTDKWDLVSYGVMLCGNAAKYEIPELRTELKKTYGTVLVEASYKVLE